ncbi:MAG: hypothetical protein ACU0B1_10505 [Thermohalobaculum sp.]
MFRTLCQAIPADPDYAPRVRRLDILQRVLDGTIYDGLFHEFHEERDAAGQYIPLRERRPCVRYGLARLVAEDSVALLFSAGHFPAIRCADDEARAALTSIARDSRLNAVMTEAALRGSVGSVAILMRVLRGRVFFDVLDAKRLTPVWDPAAPDTLVRLTEEYKVPAAALRGRGYDGIEDNGTYWFRRVWDTASETWYLPWRVGSETVPVVDRGRSVTHGLGFVPAVWIRNLPGGLGIDGACTFESAIEPAIEIDYQLSQAGRGLKYSSDPTLLIKEPAAGDGPILRGAANALVVSEKGDAKLLEIGGTACEAVIQYVRTLRELALESVHGNRVDASRLTAPASGRAFEMMNQGLLWLSDNLRVSYGECGLVPLLRQVAAASRVYPLRAGGRSVGPIADDLDITLRWPDFYAPDPMERRHEAETLVALLNAGQLSRSTAMRILAERYGIDDVATELDQVRKEGTA